MRTKNVETLTVEVRSPSGNHSSGQVRVELWDQKTRLKRALKFWGVCLGISVFSIIIPLAHFILVPGFFLAGPICAWFAYQQTRTILGGESTCPECSAALPILPASDHWPLSSQCPACRRGFKVHH